MDRAKARQRFLDESTSLVKTRLVRVEVTHYLDAVQCTKGEWARRYKWNINPHDANKLGYELNEDKWISLEEYHSEGYTDLQQALNHKEVTA